MQGSTVMRQSGAATLATEEPDAFIAHVRVCGGAGWVTTGFTRKVSPRTVRKYRPTRFDRPPGHRGPSQRWGTFMRDHARALIVHVTGCEFSVTRRCSLQSSWQPTAVHENGAVRKGANSVWC